MAGSSIRRSKRLRRNASNGVEEPNVIAPMEADIIKLKQRDYFVYTSQHFVCNVLWYPFYWEREDKQRDVDSLATSQAHEKSESSKHGTCLNNAESERDRKQESHLSDKQNSQKPNVIAPMEADIIKLKQRDYFVYTSQHFVCNVLWYPFYWEREDKQRDVDSLATSQAHEKSESSKHGTCLNNAESERDRKQESHLSDKQNSQSKQSDSVHYPNTSGASTILKNFGSKEVGSLVSVVRSSCDLIDDRANTN
nr:rho GTPase-activating protein REN1-like isoform X1 [Ipomoea batatas]